MPVPAEKPVLHTVYASGPCRSIILILKKFNLLDKVEIREMDMGKGDHRTPEFLAINPFHSVPCLTHGDLSLFESTAIIEYLNEIFKLDGEWGFANDDVQAKFKQINMLHKYHNLVVPGQRQIMTAVYKTFMGGVPFNQEEMKAGLVQTKAEQYKMLDEVLAKNGGFVAGNTPSAVDVHYWVDLFQMTADGAYTLHVYDFAEHPNIKAWIQKVKDAVFCEEIYTTKVQAFTDRANTVFEGKHKLLNF